VIIPQSFYASDGLCETSLTVLNEMGAYPAVIDRETDRYLPFLATTELMMMAVKAGIGREDAHSTIKNYAVEEAKRRRQEGAETNKLAERLTEDPAFKKAGITKEKIDAILSDRAHFVGRAREQIESVCTDADLFVKLYQKESAYEPGEIL
jgi:adenylosuccinate lyase